MGNVNIISTLQNKKDQKKAIFHSSSTVFFGIFNPNLGIDTEISLLNHFLLKRGISDVIAKVQVRALNGDLLVDENLILDQKRTYAFKLSDHLSSSFIGSVYIFFNSSENLAVPFCAVTGVIRTEKSVCGVHTYGRRLEQKELGTNIDLRQTVETGWTIRDTESKRSYAVLHGGAFELDLYIEVECTNHAGNKISYLIQEKLKPYGTLILENQVHLNGIIEHLDGKLGHAKIRINGLKGIFPRMMCGNYVASKAGDNQITHSLELQFTHTNFDFSEISQPDALSGKGYFNQPSLPDGYGLIYPVITDKKIQVSGTEYTSDTLYKFEIEEFSQIDVSVPGGTLPSRFVGASVSKWGDNLLESECSTGTFIEDYIRVPCHWHWGLLKPGFENGESQISIILNKFDRNNTLKRKLNWRVYNNQRMLIDQEIVLNDSLRVNAMDYLPRVLPEGPLWYVFSGEKLEDLNIFCTFYPGDNISGFAEHAF